MITVVYGEDRFQTREQVGRLKAEAEKRGIHVATFDGKSLNPDALDERLQTGNLFSDRAVLILKNIFSEAGGAVKDRLAILVGHLPAGIDLVLWEEGMPDRRTTLYRLLAQKAKMVETMPLKGVALTSWIEDRARKMGLRLDGKAAALLAQTTGPDLMQAEQELTKLQNFVGERPVTEDDVLKLSVGSVPPSIFELLDLLGSRNSAATILVERLLASGEDPLYVLSMLAYQLRNLLLVADLTSQDPSVRKTPLTETRTWWSGSAGKSLAP